MISGLANADLHGMTKAELLGYAEENNVEGVNPRMKKADIVEAITAGI